MVLRRGGRDGREKGSADPNEQEKLSPVLHSEGQGRRLSGEGEVGSGRV